MFDDQLFEDWLDKKTKAIFSKLGEEALSSDEMIKLVISCKVKALVWRTQRNLSKCFGKIISATTA